MNRVTQIVNKLKSKWMLRYWSMVIILGSLFTLMLIPTVFIFSIPSIVIAGMFFLGIILVLIVYKKQYPNNQKTLELINSQLKDLEYSANLIYREATNSLEKIQKNIIIKKITEINPSVSYPLELRKGIWVLSVALAISIISLFVKFTQSNELESSDFAQLTTYSEENISDSLILEKLVVLTTPPAYTGLRTSRSENPEINVPEGTFVKWSVSFNKPDTPSWIQFSDGDSLSLEKGSASKRLNENGFYSIHYLDGTNEISSSFYKIEVRPDSPPKIEIKGIPQYQRLDFEESKPLTFRTEIKDDYGLTDAFITATITKGSGEAIKFREQKISFEKEIKGKNQTLFTTLNPTDFGMEPGNELYFFITAFDNKKPEPQLTKTETYFFILEDTAEVEFSLQGNLGVDIMPDYFRSQLQIIIDTEKLIERQTSIEKEEFNRTSNELGYDQKQLRLKYGQFIGEEEDSGLEINQEEPSGENTPTGENVLQEFGHDHDHENEEGQLMDKGTEPGHDHDHEHEEGEDEGENPLQEFMHSHDDAEVATFYTQTLKSKLRAALNEMWDAELYLRLFRPQESLPYQYAALKLLKEIRNHARIYVKRIGFEPPPINKQEERLKKDAEDANDRPFYESQLKDTPLKEVSALVIEISRLNTDTQPNKLQDQLKKAGNEIAGLAIEQPGMYLETLNQLQTFINLEKFNPNDIQELKQLNVRLLNILPITESGPSSDPIHSNPLTESFIKELVSR